jgi:hypothetical protein
MKYIKNLYKEMHSEETRIEVSTRLLCKHAGKVPVIVLVDPSIKSLKDKYYKYLVSRDLSALHIINLIRHKVKIPPEKGLYGLTEKNRTLITSTMTYNEIYESNKDEDGFLYIHILCENSFGTPSSQAN